MYTVTSSPSPDLRRQLNHLSKSGLLGEVFLLDFQNRKNVLYSIMLKFRGSRRNRPRHESKKRASDFLGALTLFLSFKENF